MDEHTHYAGSFYTVPVDTQAQVDSDNLQVFQGHLESMLAKYPIEPDQFRLRFSREGLMEPGRDERNEQDYIRVARRTPLVRYGVRTGHYDEKGKLIFISPNDLMQDLEYLNRAFDTDLPRIIVEDIDEELRGGGQPHFLDIGRSYVGEPILEHIMRDIIPSMRQHGYLLHEAHMIQTNMGDQAGAFSWGKRAMGIYNFELYCMFQAHEDIFEMYPRLWEWLGNSQSALQDRIYKEFNESDN